jgi:hypothetical protein
MPIHTGDGTDIQNVRLGDGTQIQEVRRGDGTVIWTAGDAEYTLPSDVEAVVEDWEGDLSAWNNDTGSFAIVADAIEGSQALDGDHANGTTPAIYSYPGDGLGAYLRAPVKFRWYSKAGQDAGGSSVLFGVAVDGGGGHPCYQCQMGFTGDVIHLRKFENGWENAPTWEQQGSTSEPYQQDHWYYGELIWDDGTYGGSEGEITWTVFDAADDTQLAQVSNVDPDYMDNRAVGLNLYQDELSDVQLNDYIHRFDNQKPVIDSFEDQDLSEYTVRYGSKSDWNFVQDATDGTYGLNAVGSSRYFIYDDGSLPSVSRGDVWQFDWKQMGSGNYSSHVFWYQDNNNYYYTLHRRDVDRYLLRVISGGSDTKILEVNPSLSADTWYTTEIDTSDTANDAFTMRILDQSGTAVASATGADASHDSGPIGWDKNGTDSTAEVTFDYPRVR